MENGRTLKELNVQPGDVVMTAVSNGSEWVIKGKDDDVYRGVKPHYRASHPGVPLTSGPIWRIIFRAPTVPDPFHKHEALHMASVCMDLFSDRVAETVFVESEPKIAELCETAISAMMEVYQAIGSIEDGPKDALRETAKEILALKNQVSSDSPIRLVEKAEIVPGKYGRLKISKVNTRQVGIAIIYLDGNASHPTVMTAKELRETIATLQAILPVLEAE